MAEFLLDSLVTYNPWILPVSTTVGEAARLLDETGISAWPVLNDEGALLGVAEAAALAAALPAVDPSVQTIKCIVNRRATPVELAMSSKAALQALLRHRARLLPVIDSGAVVGTVSGCDFLRELGRLQPRVARDLVVDHLERHYETLDSDAPLDRAEALLARGSSYVVVVQGDFPIGAISPALLARAQVQEFARRAAQPKAVPRTVGHVLQSIPMITPSRTLAEAASLMSEHQVDALAVANQSAQLQGVITEADILLAAAA